MHNVRAYTRIAAATAVSLALLGAADAKAPVPNPVLRPSLAIAHKTWGDNMCGGVVQVVRQPLYGRGRLAQVDAIGPFPAGHPACVIKVNSNVRFSAGAYCTMLLHEGGHLAGWRPKLGEEGQRADGSRDHAHSNNPARIMYGSQVETDPRCYSVGRSWSLRPVR